MPKGYYIHKKGYRQSESSIHRKKLSIPKKIRCLSCQKGISRTGFNQKYCSNCRKIIKKEKKNIRQLKAYHARKSKEVRNCLKCRCKVGKRKFYCDNCLRLKRKNKTISENRRMYLRQRRLKLRMSIFTRDRFTCQYCGRKSPDIELQIDHIYPKSKHGKNSEANYQSLCKDCNQGKGDSVLNEFFVK